MTTNKEALEALKDKIYRFYGLALESDYSTEEEHNLWDECQDLIQTIRQALTRPQVDVEDVVSKALYRADMLFDWEDIDEFKVLVKKCFSQILKEQGYLSQPEKETNDE